MRVLLTLAILTAACGGGGVKGLRFENRPIVWKVNDRVDTEGVEQQGFPKIKYYFDRFFFRRIERGMEVPESSHALNVNAVDEVPDSTWFTNRIGARDLTAEEVGRGPNVDDGPDRSAPWKIKGTKIGGSSVGFRIKDARDVTYILKFDEKGIPEMETAADVIIQRLLWAAGYNVPEDTIVYFPREQLELADDATIEDTFGNERPMTERDLENYLARVNRSPDGTYRGLASKFLPGKPLGGLYPEGTRDGDPNDLIPHQHRRDLRGQYVIFSWVGHTDVKLDNYLDMLTDDPLDPERQYVMHYALDFGKGLGTMGYIERRPNDNFRYAVDFAHMATAVFTLGLWPLPGERADGPDIPGVARFEAKYFEPASWRPEYPWEPFLNMDRFDGFWGAKIVSRFTPEQIRAAVEAGRYTDPRATEYIYQTLLERQRKIVAYWFSRVSPLDQFEVRDGALCFRDLALDFGAFAPADQTRYRARAVDAQARPLDWTTEQPATGPHTCLPNIPLSTSPDGYTIVRLRTHRAPHKDPPVEVHLARDPTGTPHVIGLVRH